MKIDIVQLIHTVLSYTRYNVKRWKSALCGGLLRSAVRCVASEPGSGSGLNMDQQAYICRPDKILWRRPTHVCVNLDSLTTDLDITSLVWLTPGYYTISGLTEFSHLILSPIRS